MNEEDDRIDALIEAALQNAAFDEDTEYLKRGRRYSSDLDSVLKARWVESFKKLVGQPTDDNRMVLSDCSSELRRRGIEPPLDGVQADLSKLQAQIKENPDDPGVRHAIGEFLCKLNDPDA